jgi:hypothetical protein
MLMDERILFGEAEVLAAILCVANSPSVAYPYLRMQVLSQFAFFAKPVDRLL